MICVGLTYVRWPGTLSGAEGTSKLTEAASICSGKRGYPAKSVTSLKAVPKMLM